MHQRTINQVRRNPFHWPLVPGYVHVNLEQIIAEERKRALTTVRRELTEPKAAFAGVMHECFSAWSITSIALSNLGGALIPPFCWCDFEGIVGSRGRWVETERRTKHREKPGSSGS